MKAGWQTKTLGDACQIARGGSPRPIQEFLTNDPDGVNWVKISDASASGKFIYATKEKIKPSGVSRSRLVKPGDFLLSNSMSFGRPYIMQTTGCIHDGWLVLSDYEQCFDQSFLYYLLGSTVVFDQFDRLAAGSTVRNLNIELASRVSLPVPSLPEQHRIVNILADQAFNAFSVFPEDALVRIAPEDIRKKGKVPKNGSIFFTIFQTFMSGPPKDGHPSPYFGEYPPDFFDFIIIDECHRGGANDESNWRGILDYFAPAVQLGLTATPKRKDIPASARRSRRRSARYAAIRPVPARRSLAQSAASAPASARRRRKPR